MYRTLVICISILVRNTILSMLAGQRAVLSAAFSLGRVKSYPPCFDFVSLCVHCHEMTNLLNKHRNLHCRSSTSSFVVRPLICTCCILFFHLVSPLPYHHSITHGASEQNEARGNDRSLSTHRPTSTASPRSFCSSTSLSGLPSMQVQLYSSQAAQRTTAGSTHGPPPPTWRIYSLHTARRQSTLSAVDHGRGQMVLNYERLRVRDKTRHRQRRVLSLHVNHQT